MHISAKTDYALRALCVLATAPEGTAVKADEIADAQEIPRKFLDAILLDLRHAGIVESRRGSTGGHRLARPAFAVTVADVARAIEGPLMVVQGNRPETLTYDGPAARLQDVWVAARAALRSVLETTTVAQIVTGELPAAVTTWSADSSSWTSAWSSPQSSAQSSAQPK